MKISLNWLRITSFILFLVSVLATAIPSFEKATLPAFLISIFMLVFDSETKTNTSLQHTEKHSRQMSIDVKNRLEVIRIEGSIARTFDEYVIQRLDIISSIQNTSFTLENNQHQVNNAFNNSRELHDSLNEVSKYIYKGLKWEDVGDELASSRFNTWKESERKNSKGSYSAFTVKNRVPYPNFLIITYKDDRKEVLFNWDLRSPGFEPEVLVSSEKDLVNFYRIQFELLINNASTLSDQLS